MRLLLDEILDWRLRRDLSGHEVESVPLLGWAGIKNGTLLARAQKQFEVLITMDGNLPREHDLTRFDLAIIALRAPTNRLADTRPLMPKVLALLSTVQKGQLAIVSVA